MSCDSSLPNSDVAAGRRFTALGFGAFYHYGINTYAGENGGTTNPSGTFQPSTTYPATDFAPTAEISVRQWLLPAKMCGAKYAIFTAKHHFGWCAWDTAVTSGANDPDGLYDLASATDPQAPSDLVSDFVTACNDYDMKPILYFSSSDRHYNPDGTADGGAAGTAWRMDGTAALTYIKAQLAELLGDYGSIYGVWLDHHGYLDNTNKLAVYSYIKSLQPDCVVIANNSDNRISSTGCDSQGTGDPDIIDGTADVYVAESIVIPSEYTMPIEEIDKISTNDTWWGWTDTITADLSATTLATNITTANSKGGSYCIGLHVGPDGSVNVNQCERMRELGVELGLLSNSTGITND